MVSKKSNDNPHPNMNVIDLTSNTESVEKSFVSEKTINIYIGTLIRFWLWLFDNKKEHIVPDTLKEWADQHELDKIAHDNAKPPKKSTSKKKKEIIKDYTTHRIQAQALEEGYQGKFFSDETLHFGIDSRFTYHHPR